MDSPGLVVLSTLLTRHLSFHLHFHLSLHLARPPSSSPARRLVFFILFFFSVFFSQAERISIFFRVRLPWIHVSVTVCIRVLRTQTCVSVCFSLCQCVVSLREPLSLVNGTSTQVNSDWQLKPKHTPHTHRHTHHKRSLK